MKKNSSLIFGIVIVTIMILLLLISIPVLSMSGNEFYVVQGSEAGYSFPQTCGSSYCYHPATDYCGEGDTPVASFSSKPSYGFISVNCNYWTTSGTPIIGWSTMGGTLDIDDIVDLYESLGGDIDLSYIYTTAFNNGAECSSQVVGKNVTFNDIDYLCYGDNNPNQPTPTPTLTSTPEPYCCPDLYDYNITLWRDTEYNWDGEEYVSYDTVRGNWSYPPDTCWNMNVYAHNIGDTDIRLIFQDSLNVVIAEHGTYYNLSPEINAGQEGCDPLIDYEEFICQDYEDTSDNWVSCKNNLVFEYRPTNCLMSGIVGINDDIIDNFVGVSLSEGDTNCYYHTVPARDFTETGFDVIFNAFNIPHNFSWVESEWELCFTTFEFDELRIGEFNLLPAIGYLMNLLILLIIGAIARR